MRKVLFQLKSFFLNHYKYIFIFIIIICLLIGGIVVQGSTTKPNDIKNETYESDLTVTILGEVKYPNTYNLPNPSTVKDLIEKAGGLLDGADTSLINLKQKLQNNQVIRIIKNDNNNEKININTASMEELTKLKGIGETKAYNIILYRTVNGSFTDLNDLLNVEGITSKILLEIINEIKLS